MPAARLSLLTIAKNEAARLPGLVNPLAPLVTGDIVILADVDSTDATVEVAQALADRCYAVRFPDSFGELLSMGIALASLGAEWALWLDCDERLEPGAFTHLRDKVISADGRGPIYALARRRWSDWQKSRQIDPADPDWQPRLLPARGAAPIRFERRLHPYPAPGSPDVVRLLHGPPGKETEAWPWIDHFHDTKSPVELAERQDLYQRLARADRIAIEGGQPYAAPCACGHPRIAHAGALEYATPPFACETCPCRAFSDGLIDALAT